MSTGEAVPLALSWLATYWLHSTLFLGGAWLLCRLRPPRLARDRERVWKLALVGGVLSATLQLGIGARPLLGGFELRSGSPVGATEAPEEPVPLIAEDTKSESAPRSAAPETADLAPVPVRKPIRRERASAPREARGERPAPEPAGRASGPAPTLAHADSLPRSHSQPAPANEAPELARVPALERPDSKERTLASTGLAATSRALQEGWRGLVLALWSGIGFLGVAGLMASWTCLRRRMLGRERLRDGALLQRFEHLCARAGVRRRVLLTVSARIRSPFSTGWLRPEVCLPSAVLTDLSPAQQDALLAHELGHLVRRDPLWFGLGSLIERLFFFQPLNRVARLHLSELAEEACDDWAVRWTGARLALASCLAEVAGWVVGEQRRLLAPPALAGYRSRLGQRVERLLDDRRSPSGEPPAPWWPPLAAGALAVVTLAVPGVSAVRAPAPSDGADEPAPIDRPSGELTPLATAASPEPAAAPASSPAAASSAELPLELSIQRSVLASDLTLLELELAALHAELEARALRERFEGELAQIDARMAGLREQHRRQRALLERLSGPQAGATAPANTPTGAPAAVGAPARKEPDSDETQGESR